MQRCLVIEGDTDIPLCCLQQYFGTLLAEAGEATNSKRSIIPLPIIVTVVFLIITVTFFLQR